MGKTIEMTAYGLIFEWDEDKERLVFLEHKIYFSEAVSVLFDPYAITDEDYRDYDGEIRYITVGMSNQNRLLKVVWTDKDPNTRLISAWRASAQDKKDYDR